MDASCWKVCRMDGFLSVMLLQILLTAKSQTCCQALALHCKRMHCIRVLERVHTFGEPMGLS